MNDVKARKVCDYTRDKLLMGKPASRQLLWIGG